MNTCNGNREVDHDDIVHEGNNCPLCAAYIEIKHLKEDIAVLELELDNRKMDDQLASCKDACEGCPNKLVCNPTKAIMSVCPLNKRQECATCADRLKCLTGINEPSNSGGCGVDCDSDEGQ